MPMAQPVFYYLIPWSIPLGRQIFLIITRSDSRYFFEFFYEVKIIMEPNGL